MAMPIEDSPSTLGLDGRVALVTGGTRGLGLAIARKLCASGCAVYLNYRRATAQAQQALTALADLKGTAELLPGDVTADGVLPGMLDDLAQRHGAVDILVHSAVSFEPMRATEARLDGCRRDLATTLDPLLLAAPGLARVMRRPGGRVIAVSSTGSTRVVPNYVSLGMAKAALESLVRYLAVELAAAGVAVNAVATAKLNKGGDGPDRAMLARLAERTPGGRPTRPADVADVVALLCTPEAAWLHGQVVTVDGGLSLPA
jgi:enoyl-[acyl-carrier protein] reductase III